MTKQPHYHGHRERLRERLRKDPKQLEAYEILELLLGYALLRKDTKPLAKALLDKHKTLRAVMQAEAVELRECEGFGPGVEALWVLLAELRARIVESPVQARSSLNSPAQVAEWAQTRLGHLPTEEFWVALVDPRNRVIAWEPLTKGTIDQVTVYPRELLAMVLTRKAAGFIMVHNHPGGDVRPSRADTELTGRIFQAAQNLGVKMLDHLIVSESDFFSFNAQGVLGA